MDDKKQDVFDRYITYLYGTGKSYSYIGIYIKVAKDFLDSDYPLSKTGYRHYVKDNAATLSAHRQYKEALLELLNVAGIGYNRKQKQQNEIKTLEKLSVVSEKNKKLINDFIYYLTQEEDYSPHTINLYLFSLKKYFEYANEVTADNYKRFIHTLETNNYAPATIRLRITALERLSEYIGKPIKLKRPKFK